MSAKRDIKKREEGASMIKEVFTVHAGQRKQGKTVLISIDAEEQKSRFYDILKNNYGFSYIRDCERYQLDFYANYDLIVFAYDKDGFYAYIGEIGGVLNDIKIAYISATYYGVIAEGLCELLSIIAYYPNWKAMKS